MKIENREARVHHLGEELTLLPGMNELDEKGEKAFAKFANTPVVKHHLKEGAFVLVDEKKAKG